ncbi:hypothetical protein FNV43_RR06354 [Rhamnella rubrinervis]|uniref:Uncharacterized protein n=1 Tax=Rhamnella rubrinervis TaxID=2594499 RepID=A0A8K0MLB6_9ROSA|nr:hypothetical protein FNV43_RR06354 [Rhamnella rubrinervis]
MDTKLSSSCPGWRSWFDRHGPERNEVQEVNSMWMHSMPQTPTAVAKVDRLTARRDMARTAEKIRDDGRSSRATNQTSARRRTTVSCALSISDDSAETDKRREERALGIEIYQGIEVPIVLRPELIDLVHKRDN